MGTLQPADIQLSTWGASENLHVVGLFKTTVENANGASIRSMVYVVDWYQHEPLMGGRNAEELNFVIFNHTRKNPTKEDTLKKITQKLHKNLQVKVDTQTDEVKPHLDKID